NISINVSKFAPEQRYHLFAVLFDADPSISDSLSPEQRRRLYAVLIAIDYSLTRSLSDARSVICDITNEQPILEFQDDLGFTNTTETVNTFQDLILILLPKKNNQPSPQKSITPLITTATDVLDSTDTTIETINISQGRGKKKQVKPKIKKTLRQTRSNKKAKTVKTP
ncbi:7936_t:CDS:2, partial [Funneliformis mosseae]